MNNLIKEGEPKEGGHYTLCLEALYTLEILSLNLGPLT